jgi:hypothetical protein
MNFSEITSVSQSRDDCDYFQGNHDNGYRPYPWDDANCVVSIFSQMTKIRQMLKKFCLAFTYGHSRACGSPALASPWQGLSQSVPYGG